MNNINSSVPIVEKEMISDLKFPATEVLSDKFSIQDRVNTLHRATSLGNLDKHKVTILFEDSLGLKKVKTTIWALTDRKILLKAGRSIPINRIHSVQIY